jgi:hypothetical protein
MPPATLAGLFAPKAANWESSENKVTASDPAVVLLAP